jgi:hypothetical protein
VETIFFEFHRSFQKPKNSFLTVEKVVEICGETVDNNVEGEMLPSSNVKFCNGL